MKMRYKVSEETTKEDLLIVSGLLGVDVVSIFTMLTLEKLDASLNLSLYCSAVAIPLLALSVFAFTFESKYEYTTDPWYVNMAHYIGIFGSVLGLGAVFWHFSWIIALVFGIACLVAFAFMCKFDNSIQEANKKDAA